MSYICALCGYQSDTLLDFEIDEKNNLGYWCPWCDGFTYYNEVRDRHSFLLLMEDKNTLVEPKRKLNFKVNISPLRFPGGKSKIIAEIYDRCQHANLTNFVEPFCGGASVGLSFLLAGIVKELYLNDLDYGIYSLFQTIKENPSFLIERLKTLTPTKEQFFKYRSHLQSGYGENRMEEAGWMYLVVNRLSFSGIAKANPMGNLLSRWNPETLISRIQMIHSISSHIHITNIDACDLIEELYWLSNNTMLIDPPYFKKGKALYNHWYTRHDHIQLAQLLESLHGGMPGADIILTYDNAEFIDSLYDLPEKSTFGRNYSIAN